MNKMAIGNISVELIEGIFHLGIIETNNQVIEKSVYISNKVEDLKYGDVIRFIRDNFKKVGDEFEVRAHFVKTIYQAFNKAGFSGSKVKKIDDQTWLFKRVAK
jgi:hypothetical protein